MSIQQVVGTFAAVVGLTLSFNHPAAFWCVLLWLIVASLALIFEGLWLLTQPAVVTLLSFYPWTGNLIWHEYDIALSALLAGTMLRKDRAWKISREQIVWFGPLGFVLVVAALHGWWTLPSIQASDQLSVYTTNANTLLQVKILGYALILVPLISNALTQDRLNGQQTNWRRLEIGILCSSAGVAGVILLERLVSVGIFNFEQVLRVTGPFMSMHIGDQHVDAYWALAIPFIFQFRYEPRWQTLLICLLQAVTLYAVFSTMSRATIAAAIIVIAILAIARLTWFRQTEAGLLERIKVRLNEWSSVPTTIFAATLIVIAGVAMWLSGDAVPKRFADSLGGWQSRTDHWSTILKSTPTCSLERLFGFGLGSYPLRARRIVGRVEQPIGLEQSESKMAVRIHGGESIYFEQLVSSHAPLPWSIAFTCSSGNSACQPAIVVAHKVLLQSFEAVGAELVQHGDRWTGTLKQLPVDLTPESNHVRREWCPTSLGFAVQGEGSLLLSDIDIVDSRGQPVIRNGNFSRGSQNWFFTSDDHLIWRAKNCWLHLLVETGWLGVLAFGWLCVLSVLRLSRAILVRRSWSACILLCSLLGFFAVGMFGTLIDVPWIALLLLVVLTSAQSEV